MREAVKTELYMSYRNGAIIVCAVNKKDKVQLALNTLGLS